MPAHLDHQPDEDRRRGHRAPDLDRVFQAPGRLNLLDVGGIRVVIDYCHNVDGMRQLADFVNRMMVEPQAKRGAVAARPLAGGARNGRAIGVIGILRKRVQGASPPPAPGVTS